MGCMKLDHIEACLLSPMGGRDKVLRHPIHISTIHGFRHLIALRPSDSGCREQWPIALRQRRIHFFPAQLGRTFAARMTDLATDFGLCFGMDKINNPFPRHDVLIRIKTRTAQSNAPIRRDTGHFRINQTSPAFCAFAVMHEMPIGWCPVLRPILRHG